MDELERLKPLLDDPNVTDVLICGTRDVLIEIEGVLVSKEPIFESTDESIPGLRQSFPDVVLA
jgi:Flp pilus assembly CpaF family ATPase